MACSTCGKPILCLAAPAAVSPRRRRLPPSWGPRRGGRPPGPLQRPASDLSAAASPLGRWRSRVSRDGRLNPRPGPGTSLCLSSSDTAAAALLGSGVASRPHPSLRDLNSLRRRPGPIRAMSPDSSAPAAAAAASTADSSLGAYRAGASVAVIGAGPAGLVAAKELLEAGLRVTVFDRRRNVGGMWASSPPSSPFASAVVPGAGSGIARTSPPMRTNLSRYVEEGVQSTA